MTDEIPKPGSTISLISSAQVRYEGILEIIQMGPDESSITLANVVQYGTEDRPAPTFVAASGNRFDSICFKGADIISLDVKEYYRDPPPQQVQPQPYSHSPSQYHRQPPPQPRTEDPVWGPPGPPRQQETWGTPAATQQPTPAQYAQPSAPPAASQQGWQGPAPAPTVVVTPSIASRTQPQPRQAPPRQSSWSNTAAPATAPSRPMQSANSQAPPLGSTQPSLPSGAGSSKQSAGPPPGFHGPPPGMQGSQSAAESPRQANGSAPLAAGPMASDGVEAARGRGSGRRSRGRSDRNQNQSREPRASNTPRAPPVPVPNEDFNFEEGLSKFDKVKEEGELNERPQAVSSTVQAYNPKDDFFDDLSSDLSRLSAQEKPQRVPFSEQRKVDMETFGGSGVARRPMRGRGGRGGRGRGKARGGSRGNQTAPFAVAT